MITKVSARVNPTGYYQKRKLNQKAIVTQNTSFNGKEGKIAGTVIGGILGGAAGGAIIGGGTLAGMAALAATGPIGLGLAAIYTVGGAIAGGYLGNGLGDGFSGEDDNDKGN